MLHPVVVDDDSYFSDEEIDELLDAWDQLDREAAAYLDDHLPATGEIPDLELARATRGLRDGVARGVWPFGYFVHALDWTTGVPGRARTAWLEAAAATISPPNDPLIDVEKQSAVMALDHTDWLGMVIGLVQRGVGAEFSAGLVQEDVDALENIEGEVEDREGQLSVLETAVATLSPLWQALSVLDESDRLTALGRWGLPRGLRRVWVASDLG
jgi:hypothetical protein